MTAAEYKTILRYQQEAPVDISALATELGLSVYESYSLPPGISGKISRSDDGKFAITVNRRDAYRRRRFTIAHECAHYLLHREKIGTGVLDDAMYRSEQLTSQDEFDANNKAADLLMPRHLVLKFVKDGCTQPHSLADLFAVSEAAMEVRLRYLYWQT